MTILSSLYIGETPGMGRGVFTSEAIEAGAVVEVSPVIVMTNEERTHIDQTKLHDYIFEWGDELDHCCMAMGYIPVYNHSFQSNCEYEMDYDDGTMMIKAVRAIQAGEELFINYNGDWNNEKPLWFDAK